MGSIGKISCLAIATVQQSDQVSRSQQEPQQAPSDSHLHILESATQHGEQFPRRKTLNLWLIEPPDLYSNVFEVQAY